MRWLLSPPWGTPGCFLEKVICFAVVKKAHAAGGMCGNTSATPLPRHRCGAAEYSCQSCSSESQLCSWDCNSGKKLSLDLDESSSPLSLSWIRVKVFHLFVLQRDWVPPVAAETSGGCVCWAFGKENSVCMCCELQHTEARISRGVAVSKMMPLQLFLNETPDTLHGFSWTSGLWFLWTYLILLAWQLLGAFH